VLVSPSPPFFLLVPIRRRNGPNLIKVETLVRKKMGPKSPISVLASKLLAISKRLSRCVVLGGRIFSLENPSSGTKGNLV